jgi:predicted nucleotidyltransferase
LSNLENTGVVKRFAGKREHLFVFNRKNYLAKNLLDNLFIAETKYRQDIFKVIKTKLKNVSHSIILFGSAARGSDNLRSDLDICLVYKSPKKKVEELVTDLRTELSAVFNISLAPFYLTAAQFKEYGLNKKPPVNSIIKDGKIIYGKSIKDLLNG